MNGGGVVLVGRLWSCNPREAIDHSTHGEIIKKYFSLFLKLALHAYKLPQTEKKETKNTRND